MPTEPTPDERPAPRPVDVGLLSPVTAGHDAAVSDAAIVDALVAAEVALVRARAAVEASTPGVADEVSAALGWQGRGAGCLGHGIDPSELAARGVVGGNPVIPLVPLLRAALSRAGVSAEAAAVLHRGATSQDVLDSALALVARAAAAQTLRSLELTAGALTAFATAHRDQVAAARTLTQHAVPTTTGARAAGWVRGIRRAIARLDAATTALPAQLGGAAGTLAAFVAELGDERAAALPAAFAHELGLAAPEAPWHTNRWPITELGDALTQALDALGTFAADVATLSRTEIGELREGVGGGSSTMPQKANPVASVLIRSAALRAPQLGATLHLAAALAVDERPDGAWHAEWPALRELLRLGLGASAQAVALAEGLEVDADAVARTLALTGAGIVAERLAGVLVPLIGRERFDELIAGDAVGGAVSGTALADRIRALPEASGLDLDALLDPAGYTGLAGRLVDAVAAEQAVAAGRTDHVDPAQEDDRA